MTVKTMEEVKNVVDEAVRSASEVALDMVRMKENVTETSISLISGTSGDKNNESVTEVETEDPEETLQAGTGIEDSVSVYDTGAGDHDAQAQNSAGHSIKEPVQEQQEQLADEMTIG